MSLEVKVYCENTGEELFCAPGTTLSELAKKNGVNLKWPLLAALVDNQLKELNFEIYVTHNVNFLDYSHPDGYRTYLRSLYFVVQKAVSDLFPTSTLILDYAIQNGMYGELRGDVKDEKGVAETLVLDDAQIEKLRKKVAELIEADLPFTRKKYRTEDASKIFISQGNLEKAFLHTERGKFFTTVYYLDGYANHFYGPLLESTGFITVYSIEMFKSGFLIKTPYMTLPYEIVEMPTQHKLFNVFKEYSDWCSILGVKNIWTLNTAIKAGKITELIQISEALHERKYAAIADEIYERRDQLKLVLISGPSSSGKTTTSKRIALQLKVLGLNPVIIELDNYFVNRENTPFDEDGNRDYESLLALDLEFLNTQLNELFEGKEILLPKFDFAKGERVFNGERLRLNEKDILIMEGIHGLNPRLTEKIPSHRKYSIYASALTSLSIDENNSISTSDNRLLRRIVRDNNYRGISPEDTIKRWMSVRRGEIRNIFPFQENADIMFNSALIYELSLLKLYAEPLLRKIPPISPASSESIRLLKFLSYIQELDVKDVDTVPPTSVMREFIGGSTLKY